MSDSLTPGNKVAKAVAETVFFDLDNLIDLIENSDLPFGAHADLLFHIKGARDGVMGAYSTARNNGYKG